MPTWEDISPYTDRAVRSRRLTATNVLVVLNIAGLLATGLCEGALGLPRLVQAARFDAAQAVGEFKLWQFVTYPFVQALDPVFLFWFVAGAYALYTLGNELEAEIGRGRTILYYFSFSAYGGLAHAIHQYAAPGGPAAMTFLAPAYGLLAAGALRAPARPVLFLFLLPMRRLTAVLFMGVGLILTGVLYAKAGLAPWPVVGATLAALAVVKLEPRFDAALERRAARRERDRVVEEVEVRRETDRILEKISREGMDRLTRRERKILQRAAEIAGRKRRLRDE
jgi:membrane associated rhomboid family serine protease